jgi:hypothetical protein
MFIQTRKKMFGSFQVLILFLETIDYRKLKLAKMLMLEL